MSVSDRALQVANQDRHNKLCAMVKADVPAVMRIARHLRELESIEVYKKTHKTFAKFVAEELGFEQAHAYRLIDAAKVEENISPIGENIMKPQTESQYREVAKAPPEKQAEVVRKAAEKAAKENRKPTAKDYKQVVGELVLDDVETEEPVETPVVAVSGLSGVDLALQNGKALNTIVGLLQKAKRECKAIEEQPGLEIFVSKEKSIQRDIDAAIGAIQVTIPRAVCPRCNGRCCVQCGNHGWVNKTLLKSLEESGE